MIKKVKKVEHQIVPRETECNTVANLLKGAPTKIKADIKTLKYLCNIGVAMDFGDEGYGRGYRWREYVLKRF